MMITPAIAKRSTVRKLPARLAQRGKKAAEQKISAMLLVIFSITTFLQIPVAAADEITPLYGSSGSMPTSEKMASYGCRGCIGVSQGMMSYGYPFKFPAGRNGLTPDVALSYSQSSDNQSIVAPGWNLSYGGSIERSVRKGPKAAATLNEFIVTLGGSQQKILPISLTDSTHGIYGARFEDQQLLYEFRSDDSWLVTDTNGTTYTFGLTAAAKQLNANLAGATFTWMLEKIEDTNSNSIAFSYFQDANQIYPKEISYTNHGAETGNYKLLFNFTPRSTPAVSFARGFEIKIKYRIGNIQLLVNNISTTQPQKDYTFNYSAQTATDSTQNLLSVTEKGWNGTAYETLPATEFQYNDTSAIDFTKGNSENYLFPDPGTIAPFTKVIADINNDGLTDIIDTLPHTATVWLHNGVNGWVQQSDNEKWKIPYGFDERYDFIADINNDGYQDLIRDGGTEGKLVYLNNKVNGWEQEADSKKWKIPDSWFDTHRLAVDINNDGLVDLINTSNGDARVFLNNGVNGWNENSAADWQMPPACVNGPYRVLADINADGLPDFICTIASGAEWLYLHNGINGWEEVPNSSDNWQQPNAWIEKFGLGADVNNDGNLDLLNPGLSINQYIHNGVNGWNVAQKDFDFSWAYSDQRKFFADIDNDGTGDAIFTFPEPKAYVRTGNSNKKYLISVKNPYGGEMKISYKPIKSFRSENQQLNPKMDANFSAVAEIQNFDRGTLQSKTSFSYAGGQQLYEGADPYSYNFAGFETVRTTDMNGNYTVDYFHQGDGVNNAEKGEVEDSLAKRGRKYRSETYSADGKLLNVELSRYAVTGLAGGATTGGGAAVTGGGVPAGARFAVRLVQKTVLDFEGGSSARAKAATYEYDSFGNPTVITDFGEVSVANAAGDFSDIGSDKLVTTKTYALNASKHIVSLPSRAVVADNGGGTVKESKWYYDSQGSGAVDRGNLTKSEQLVAGGTYVSSQLTYDDYGLPTSATDPRGNVTTTTYDALHLYPASVTNAKNQTSSFAYDYRTGAAVRMTDANGAVTSTSLDAFGRPVKTEVSNPDGSAGNSSSAQPSGGSAGSAASANLVTTATFSYNFSTLPRSKTVRVFADATGATDASGSKDTESVVYFDGSQRPIQARTETEGTDKFIVSSTIYNDQGGVKKQLLPVIGSGNSFSAIDAASPGTTFTYDALKRPTSAVNALGTASTSYGRWTKTTTDALGHQKDFAFDARGNLTSVTEHISGAAKTTNYNYDASGNLVRLTDSSGNTRALSYDLLGRKMSEEELHAPGGTVYTNTYTYDPAGNLLNSTDPKNQTIVRTYDALNRQLTEELSGATAGQATTQTSYAYDTGTNGIGRVANVNYPGGSATYTYDILGRVTAENKTIGASSYVTSSQYDLRGQPTNIIYPLDGTKVTYGYDNAGLLDTVYVNSVNLNNNNQTTPIISGLTYAPTGSYEKISFGSGAVTTNTFPINQLYRLSNRTTQKGATKLQDFAYSYDANNNITRIVDSSNTDSAKTADYTYDDLDRLLSATIVSAAANTPIAKNYTQSYSYDATGNMLSKSDVGTYSYTGTHPHAVTKVIQPSGASATGDKTYQYDANGNLTKAPNTVASATATWTHTYDFNDRLISSTDGTQTINYAYDHSGERISKENITTGKKSIYVNKFYEITDGEIQRHIYAGNLKVATLSDTMEYPTCPTPTAVSGKTTVWKPIQSCMMNGTTATGNGGTLSVSLLFRLANDTNTRLIYHHSDHLTGASVETDDKGVPIEILDYYPYGSEHLNTRQGRYNTPHKFTGKELDTDTGLYYYGARYYDANLGRFTSIDPWGGDMADPQSFNKYSYVRNNPLKYTDPTGKFFTNFSKEEIMVYEKAYATNSYGPYTERNEKYFRERSHDSHIGPSSVLELMLDNDESKAERSALINYEGIDVSQLSNEDFYNHAKALEATHDKKMMHLVMGIMERGMPGENGPIIPSKTVGTGKGWRVDVENPKPGGRPGQVHYHDYQTKLKAIYDSSKKAWKNAEPGASLSNSANKALLNNKNVMRAVDKGLKYLNNNK